MKTIYLLNKFLIIANSILFLTLYLGMLFLIITGAVQILCFLYYSYHWKRVEPHLKRHFRYYAFLAFATLLVLQSIKYFKSIDFLFWTPILSGFVLSIYFFILSKWQKEYTTQLKSLPL